MRKYSVEEIDYMRMCLWTILHPRTNGYYGDEFERKIEDRLRTYMLNGTDPEELWDKVLKSMDKDALETVVKKGSRIFPADCTTA